MSDRTLKYTEALREATAQMLAENDQVFVMGLGIPQGAAGTTAGLKDEYSSRVLDTPISESALTGLAVGAAISGMHPVVYHERVEFALVAADQIFTQAAKWNYMFGGDNPVPLTLRIAVGRKWGNGPQHSQALYSLFGTVRGLKVVIASTPYMAKGLLISAIRDKNPVVLLENLWLYQVREDVPEDVYTVPLDEARIVQDGSDITVVAYGDGFVDALSALALLPEDISVELIDLVSINPVDYDTIESSVRKTGRLITIDTTNAAFSVGGDIIAKMTERGIPMQSIPVAVATPDVPVPTSSALLEFYYPSKVDLANTVRKMFGKELLETTLSFEELQLPPTHTL